MGTYRSRLQIIADVLAVVKGGARKTRIMYQANLSYKLLSRYLDEVLETGLVELGNDDCYELTQRGTKFLDKFDEYFERRRSIEERLNDVMDEKMILEDMLFNAKAVEANSPRNKRKRKKK
jgi:predicted transcriptional regulator